MHKVKIVGVGWEQYTGLLGMVPFKDGISERPLTPQEMSRIGACIMLVKVDTDEQVGAATTMAESRNISAEVAPSLQKAVEAPVIEPVKLKHSKEDLEILASEGGIKAIREVGKEYDVKGVEISKMIDDIIKAQLGTKDED